MCVCVLPGSGNQSLCVWLCFDMLNATLCVCGGYRAYSFSPFLLLLSVDWSMQASCSLLNPLITFWLWCCGHVRGAVYSCYLSMGSYLGSVFLHRECTTAILVSTNPLIMAFITSKNTRESVTRQEHASQYLLSDKMHMCMKCRTETVLHFTGASFKKNFNTLSLDLLWTHMKQSGGSSS